MYYTYKLLYGKKKKMLRAFREQEWVSTDAASQTQALMQVVELGLELTERENKSLTLLQDSSKETLPDNGLNREFGSPGALQVWHFSFPRKKQLVMSTAEKTPWLCPSRNCSVTFMWFFFLEDLFSFLFTSETLWEKNWTTSDRVYTKAQWRETHQ